MSQGFRASNGWHIDKAGNVCTPSGVVVITGGESEHVAKFFQELRDHELGRWRDKEQPGYVVYRRDANSVLVVDEANGATKYFLAPTVVSETREGFDGAARRFYAAHPQHKPLPTEPGMYVHREAFMDDPTNVDVLTLREECWLSDLDIGKSPRERAQSWHDAGELVRLVPESGDDE